MTGRDAVAAELREAQETHAHALSYAEQRAAQLQEQLAVLTAQSTSTSRAHEAALLAAETQNRDRVAIMQCDIDAKTQALKHMQASLDALQVSHLTRPPLSHYHPHSTHLRLPRPARTPLPMLNVPLLRSALRYNASPSNLLPRSRPYGHRPASWMSRNVRDGI